MKTFANIQKEIISHLKSSARSAQGLLYSIGLVVTLLLVGTGNVWGATVTQTYTLSADDNGDEVTTGDVSWNIGNSAIVASSSNMKLTGTITVTLPTGATLESVSLTKSNNWGSGATVTLYAGSTSLNAFSGPGSFTLSSNKTNGTYKFTKTGTSSKNAWVKTISVTYTPATATKTYHEWNGSSAFTTSSGGATLKEVPSLCDWAIEPYGWCSEENYASSDYPTAKIWFEDDSWPAGKTDLYALYRVGSSPYYYSTKPTIYTITYNLTNASKDDEYSYSCMSDMVDVLGTSNFYGYFKPATGYILDESSISITMGGSPVSSSNYSWDPEYSYAGYDYTAELYMENITGNVVVTVTGKTCTPLTAPTGLTLSTDHQGTAGKTRFGWNSVSGATGYKVTVTKGGVSASVTTASDRYYYITTFPDGDYTWTVQALGDGSTYCAEGTAANGTPFSYCHKDVSGVTPTVNAATSITTTGATANWTAVSDADHYTIKVYEGTNASGTLRKTYSDVTGTSQAITGLTAGAATTYYIEVQAHDACGHNSSKAGVTFTTLAAHYTITYNKDAYSSGDQIAAGDKTHGVNFTLTSSVYTRDGYRQDGWATSSGGSKVYNIGDTYTGNANLNLYPHWAEITYTNYRTTCEDPKTLDHIAITTNPTKLNYLVGETVDVTGAVVTAYYTDETNSVVTPSVTWTAPSGALSAGLNQNLTASYTLGGVTKTATNAVINVYAVTLLKKDETGATISGELSAAPAVSLTSVNHLTAAETGNQYTFWKWEVSNGSLSSTSSLTPTIDAVSGAITVTAIYYKPITVTWSVNGSVYSGPSIHSHGWNTIYPSDPTPASVGCEGKVFIGWSRTPDYRSDDTAPTDMVESGEALTKDEHFYAVFADKESEGTAPEWTKTALGSVTAGTYLICTTNGKPFNGTMSSGHGQPTGSAFSSANWALDVFNEDAPIGAQEITFSTNGSGWKMYVEGSGYLYATKASSGGFSYQADAGEEYWYESSSAWRYSKNYSGNYAYLRVYSSTFRTYNSSTGGDAGIVLLKKTAAGSPAVYSDYTTSCTCKGFSFHTGSGTDDAVKTTNTRTCFEQVDASTTWKIDDYVIPSDAKFFVGWQDEFKSSGLGTSSRSAVTAFNADEAMYFEYTKNYGAGYRPSVGNAEGAIGTLRIWSDNDWNNCHVGFDPNGYIFKLGSTYYTMSNSATLDGARYKETEVITLTSSDISGQFQVNIAAVAPNVSTGVASRYTESKNLTTMGVKSGASTWRGTSINNAADANTKGFFRIDKGEGGATNWNAHWVPCYELTFDLKGGTGTIVTTPEYVSVEAASKVVTIPTTAPTKSGYRFMGWSDADDNTVEYAAGSTHNVTLSGNKTVYAVWKQEFTVTYNYAGGSADPACAGGTFVAGETVTVCTTTPTKTASTFNGWSYSPSVTVTAGQFTMPESNVVVTATWIDTDYTLTHNGTNYTNTEDKTSIKSGDTPFDLHYTCTGTYAFPNSISITGGGKSWTMGTDYTWVVAGDKQSATLHINESIISANVTIEITMQTRCTITYTIPTGGGSCATEPTTAVLSGETVTLPNVTGISSAYSCETFLGWTTTAPNGSGTWASTPSYKTAGATSDAITGNTTFYAVYSRAGAGASGDVELTQQEITDNFYSTNGTIQAYNYVQTYTNGSGDTWETDGYTGNNSYIQIAYQKSSSPYTVYNAYIKLPTVGGNYRSITLNHNSNSSSRTIVYRTAKNEDAVASHTTPAYATSSTIDIASGTTGGYIMMTGSYTYQITSITASYGPAPIVSHSLYCGCEIAEFDLTYDANTANYPGSTITPCTGVTGYKWTEHDDKYTICSSTPTCDGYKFIGWNTQANGSGEDGYLYQPSEEVSCWGEASVTLYAQYERVYTVTFNNQGVTTPVTQASEGATIAVPSATSPCSAEWAFVGWSETAIAPMSMLPTLEITAGTSTYTPDDDITLYAIYRKTSESSAFVAGMSGAYKISNGGDVYAGAATGKLAETNAAGAVTYYITYTAADGGKYTIQRNDGKYIAYSGSSTDLSVSDAAYYWTMTKKGSLWHVFATTSTDRYLQYSSGTGFKAYNFSTTTDIAFVAADGQYYYRTMSCEDEFDITFHDNGTTINWAGGYPEASYKDLADATVVSTFPTATFDGWTFLGWRTADYEESTTAPASSGIYGGSNGTSGNTLTIASANVDLYPVFTRFEDNEPFDQINGGDYYIYYLSNTDDGYGAYKRVYAGEYADKKRYESTPLCSSATEFTFTKLENGKWTILDKNTGKYLYGTTGEEDKILQKDVSTEWTIEVYSGNQFTATCSTNTYGKLKAYGDGTSARFMLYANSNDAEPGYHRVYLGSCTNRTFTTNPSTTPNIELHGQVKVTSTADKSIKAASVLTVSASNIATANLMFTSDNSAFKFSLTSNGTYTASVNIPVVSNKVGVTPIYVEYTPTATTDGIEEATITVSDGASPTPTTATTNTGDVQGRHVPAQFVIAAKWGDKWYALPANCTESTSSTTGVLIEVDNASDPTTATYAPSYTKWGLQTVRPSRKAEYGTRLVFTEQVTTATAEDQKTLYNGSTTNIQANAMYKNYMGDATDKYEWIPTTTDLKDYILTSATTLGGDASARTVSLSNKGVFGTLLTNKAYDGKVRLLPATFVEPAEIQVIEWKENSLVVMYGGSGTKAITQLGDDAPSSAQSLSSAKIDHGVFELTTGALTSAKNEPLNITIQNGSDVIVGRKSFVVPAIVSGSQDAPLGLETDETKLTDVVILDGATLSAVATKYTFKNITVYPGGKLVIGSGKQLGMASLTLRGGSSWGAATYEHKYPQFVVNNTADGAYSNSAAVINYDYVTTKAQYYTFVLPYNGSTSTIKYPVDIYGSAVSASNTGSFEFQYYDGAARAGGGTGWAVLAEPATLVAGTGYTFLGMPKKVDAYDGTDNSHASSRQTYGIHRIPMSVAAGTVQSGENNNKTAPLSVTLADKNNNSGWNLVGNPFMSTLTGMSSTDIQVGNLIHSDTDPWDGKWRWNPESSQRFVVIPDDNGQDYKSYQATTAVLPAFKNFFVQISNSGATTISFAASGRNDKNLIRALLTNEQEKDIELAVDLVSATKSDKVDLLINDTYSAEFDQDADFTKMMNGSKLNIYGVYPDDKLSFIAVDKTTASNSIAIGYQVPEAGEYILRLSDLDYVMADAIEALYVTDHEMSPEITTNLLEDEYPFHVNQAEINDTRFTVSIKIKSGTNTATDIDDIRDVSDQPKKFLYRDKMYILRGGKIYDATGKQVREIK